MAKFYPTENIYYCPRGCEGKFQANLYNEEGNPTQEVDWPELIRMVGEHNDICSYENPHTEDSEAFYGDVQSCHEEPGYCTY